MSGPYWGPYWGPATRPLSYGGWGGWNYGGWGGWVDYVETGRVTVEVIDADTNKLVFRAEAQKDDRNFRQPDHIRKVIDKALAGYPTIRPAAAS
jgi:hypothetical protein